MKKGKTIPCCSTLCYHIILQRKTLAIFHVLAFLSQLNRVGLTLFCLRVGISMPVNSCRFNYVVVFDSSIFDCRFRFRIADYFQLHFNPVGLNYAV
jgi:hypothetical protein